MSQICVCVLTTASAFRFASALSSSTEASMVLNWNVFVSTCLGHMARSSSCPIDTLNMFQGLFDILLKTKNSPRIAECLKVRELN